MFKKREEERKSKNTVKDEISSYFALRCYCLDHFLCDFFHCAYAFICVTVYCISQRFADKQKKKGVCVHFYIHVSYI